jgi:hypothetical protein
MHKFYFSIAALLSSGIFAYSYWKEWIAINYLGEEALLIEAANAPYFHASETLYSQVLLTFAILFTGIFMTSLLLTIKKKYKGVFFCFIVSMLAILTVMVNGAIK